MATREIVMVPLASLAGSLDNPRRSMNPEHLAELAGSIQVHGVQVPLLVRYVAGFAGYEIVTGHRRAQAARIAGLDEVTCISRAMSDEQAREIAVVENLQREDLPPLEEADAYAALVETLGTAERVALRVSKPVEYVARPRYS